MKMAMSFLLAILAIPAQEKTYDLKLSWMPIKGHKSELAETVSMKMAMKATGMPEPMTMAEESNFAAMTVKTIK